MTDFHTHILPGIDDGSKDIDMTAAMLEEEMRQGVSHIYATPHFYAHRRPIVSFIDRRAGALDVTCRMLEQRPELPRITPGAEVYYFSGMGRADQLPELCIEGTNILLLEMPFEQWHSDIVTDIKDMMRRRGLHIVLAHVERYDRFQKNRDVWNRIIEMPLTIQMNAESFIDADARFFASREHKLCMRMLAEHDNCIIGTDCHNMTSRAPNLAEARRVIEKKAGAGRLAALDRYTEELLQVPTGV